MWHSASGRGRYVQPIPDRMRPFSATLKEHSRHMPAKPPLPQCPPTYPHTSTNRLPPHCFCPNHRTHPTHIPVPPYLSLDWIPPVARIGCITSFPASDTDMQPKCRAPRNVLHLNAELFHQQGGLLRKCPLGSQTHQLVRLLDGQRCCQRGIERQFCLDEFHLLPQAHGGG